MKLLNEGFEKLKTIQDADIIMIQGNHDLEKRVLLREDGENCDLIKAEERLSRGRIENYLYHDIYDEKSGTLILWIDTTMYVEESKFKEKYDECYAA